MTRSCLLVLLLSSQGRAAEPHPEPSTTAKVVKVMDWTAVSLLSVGFTLHSASLLSDDARRRSGEQVQPFSPLFSASLGLLGGGLMTGLTSLLIKSVVKLTAPASDVPGPWDMVAAPGPIGSVLQVSGLVVAMVGLLAFSLAPTDSSELATALRAGGGLAAAAGMLTAMVGGELKETPALSVAPVAGGAVVHVSASW